MAVQVHLRGAVKRLPYVRGVVARLHALEARQQQLTEDIEARQQQLTADLEARWQQVVAELDATMQEAVRQLGQVKAPPPAFPAGHYYSPIPDLDGLRARAGAIWPDPAPRALAGIELNEVGQIALLEAVAGYYDEQPFAAQPRNGLRYGFNNDFYSYGDALYLYGLLRHLQPRHVVEVGSGHSSAVILDTIQLFLKGGVACTFIDPEPDRLFSLLREHDQGNVQIHAQPVQNVPVSQFTNLDTNDVLFIDGSHVAKVGSDVNYLLFEVLPKLRAGVYVHIHDIFYPFEYPRPWVEQGFAWNEAYLVRAFLMYNQAFEIALFGDYLAQFHRQRLASLMPLVLQNTGGSLWLRHV